MIEKSRQTGRVLREAQLAEIAAVKAAGDALLQAINEAGPGREASIARTKVEEAVMWAVKGVTAA